MVTFVITILLWRSTGSAAHPLLPVGICAWICSPPNRNNPAWMLNQSISYQAAIIAYGKTPFNTQYIDILRLLWNMHC